MEVIKINHNVNHLKNKIKNLEMKIPSKEYSITFSERKKIINKIWRSPECKEYLQLMSLGKDEEAQKLLGKQPKEIQVHIKGAWNMKWKYGDIFKEIALGRLEDEKKDKK